jgi:hypothetical protein
MLLRQRAIYLLIGTAYQEDESKKIFLLVHIHDNMFRLPKGAYIVLGLTFTYHSSALKLSSKQLIEIVS